MVSRGWTMAVMALIGVYVLLRCIIAAMGDHRTESVKFGEVEQQLGVGFIFGGICLIAGVRALEPWAASQQTVRPWSRPLGAAIAVGAAMLLLGAAGADARLLLGGTMMWTPATPLESDVSTRKLHALQAAYLGAAAAVPALLGLAAISLQSAYHFLRPPPAQVTGPGVS